MPKNILIIHGSPRIGGNSDMLCDRLIEGARESGHICEKIADYNIFLMHSSVVEVDGYAYAKEPVPGDMTQGENFYHGALLRFDMSKKPAWYALDELINKTWHKIYTNK